MKVWAVITVFAASLCIPTVDWAHDWYSDLRQPGTNQLCCGDHHCHHIDDGNVRIHGDNLQIFIEGLWHKVDSRLILSRRSPDEKLHACWLNYRHRESAPIAILSVILPPES
jgi:hypothetical protein